jgi:hypothetical protein
MGKSNLSAVALQAAALVNQGTLPVCTCQNEKLRKTWLEQYRSQRQRRLQTLSGATHGPRAAEQLAPASSGLPAPGDSAPRQPQPSHRPAQRRVGLLSGPREHRRRCRSYQAGRQAAPATVPPASSCACQLHAASAAPLPDYPRHLHQTPCLSHRQLRRPVPGSCESLPRRPYRHG